MGAAPQLELIRIDDTPFEVLGTHITPIPLIHGPYCRVYGFRFGNLAYCTDTNQIESGSMDLLHGLDTLILDALRYTPHPTHFCIEEALAIIEQLKPKKAYLTHLSHEIDYEKVNARLPSSVRLAYDGLRIPLT